MARSFTSREAKQVIKEHELLLHDLEITMNQESVLRQEIINAADKLAAIETLRILRTIPVEEINRNKNGFRVKNLKESGFETIADLASVPVSRIAAVNGVSEDSAYLINSIVKSITSKARMDAQIRLSIDNQTEEYSNLIKSVSDYQKGQQFTAGARRLLKDNAEKIRASIKQLIPGKNELSWLFASKRKKEDAEAAYTHLSTLLDGSYREDSSLCIHRLVDIRKEPVSAGWNEFRNNPVKFSNTLEKIVPGLLGNPDAEYGLPDDLARSIQDECFYPDGLLCELRRYQEWGVKYILHQKRVLLGDEMGLGKTVQAIATMVSLKNTGASHFIVVCPASVLSNWCREIRKMSKLHVIEVHGAGRKSAFCSWLDMGGVAVTTYETTSYFCMANGYRFDLLVVDEAHYIKNKTANRSMSVRALSEHADRLLFMTGTALENHVDEMISLIEVLQPQIARQIQNIAFMAAAPQFRKKIAPVYYRRKREDVLTELPDLIEKEEWCTLCSIERHEYENALLAKKYSDARRVSWSVDDLKFSSKAQRLLEIVDEAKSDGRKVIVFSFFLDTIRKVCSLFGSNCMNSINGSVSPQRRQEIIDEFEKAPDGAVLAAQIQSGGTGLNIQSASVVIICEPQFKPSIENQAISRAYRMGQTRNVLVFRLLCEDTIEEKMVDMLAAKQAEFNAFADKSAAAQSDLEIDEKSFGSIIEEEIEKIKQKNGVA